MTQTRIGVVINPISGRRGSRRGEAAYRRAFVARVLAAAGVEADIRVTTATGDATRLARSCVDDGCRVVVAMGGDGTVNEAAQGLLGSAVPLAIVPCGSGDGLARGLGIPTNWTRALHVALTGATTAIDVGYANDRIFLNICGIGFDAAVGQLFATRKKRGALGYVEKSVQLVWSYRAPHYDIVGDDWHRSGRLFLAGFANAPEYGNGAMLSPDADVCDGLLDVVLVKAGSPMSQIWRARRLYWRHRAPAEGLERLRTRTATVTGGPIVCHLDGEVWEVNGPLGIRVESRALAVRVPESRT